MLKKAGAVAAAAAGLMMLGAPAFAGVPGGNGTGGGGNGVHGDHKDQGQIGLVNVQDLEVAKNVAVTLGLCNNNVGAAIGAAVPILSPHIVGNCASSVVESSDN
jgi:hypothetical protein